MNFVAYCIYVVICIPLSLIPLPVLHWLSDGLAWVLFEAIGYRKDVISNNIKRSFPDASQQEINTIKRQFQRSFCDVFFAEMIKGLSPFKNYLDRMLVLKNPEVVAQFYKQNKGVILICGHFGNWELTAHLGHDTRFKHRLMAIFKPQGAISNFLINKSRTKTGASMVPMDLVSRSFLEQKDFLPAYLFAGDQSPANPKNAFWLTFLNQETGVFLGAERMAIKFDYPVIYLELLRVKRGQYEATFTVVSDNPKETLPGEITTKHCALLEQSILKSPGDWLWSHRRWKHKNPQAA